MVFNKLAVTAIPQVALLVSFQMVVAVLLLSTFGWKSLHVGSYYDMLRWARVAPFYAGVLISSMFALRSASMTLVIVFRSLAPLFGLAVEAFYPTPYAITKGTVVTLVMMLVGVGLFCVNLEMDHLNAIGWVLLNNGFVVGDRLLQRLMLGKDQFPVDISKTSLTLMNNIFGMIPLLIVAFCNGELYLVQASVATASSIDLAFVGVSAIVGCGIAYSGIWTQSLISATSFLVLATSNKFFVVLIEVYVMKTKTLTKLQLLGAAITILAGVAYGKVREAVELSQRENTEEKNPLLADQASKKV